MREAIPDSTLQAMSTVNDEAFPLDRFVVAANPAPKYPTRLRRFFDTVCQSAAKKARGPFCKDRSFTARPNSFTSVGGTEQTGLLPYRCGRVAVGYRLFKLVAANPKVLCPMPYPVIVAQIDPASILRFPDGQFVHARNPPKPQ